MAKQPVAVQLPDYKMTFEPMTIKHLGLRLYSTLPPVISELVSNAFDAESPKVEVQFPKGAITAESEVIVRDFGHGLTPLELQTDYLPIGRDRRVATKSELSKNGKVKVTGRKGLGKLSAFGVAKEVQVTTFRAGQSVSLLLRLDEMMEWANKNQGQPYKPKLVEERTGKTDEDDGVEVRLRHLNRKKPISEDDVRKGLALRLAVIGKGFNVKVNGTSIGKDDRLTKDDCAPGQCWDVEDIPNGGGIVADGLKVTGWIGFLKQSSSTLRGVDIFASGKAVELGSFFNYASTHAQFARAHLCGVIEAEFLDSEDEDLVSTARNSVVWESDAGQQLQEWGARVLRWAFDEWIAMRSGVAEQKLISTAGFDKWLDSRNPREQRTAQRLIKVLVKNPETELPTDAAESILEIVKSSVESVAFGELLDALENDDQRSVERLIKLFEEWRVIEARQHLQLADGRMSAIAQLDHFMKVGALEVQELQPLLMENLWLIDPAWSEANEQVNFSKMLREASDTEEPSDLDEKDRRLDIFAVTSGGTATIVELKRPEKTLSRKDLDQIAHYVDFARANMGTGPDAPRFISGLLLVGKLNPKGDVQRAMDRLAGNDIRVQCYSDLHERSRRYYAEVEKALKKVAPEYMRRKKAKAGA